MKVQLIFKWFDFWIGIFYDQKKNWIYIPMVGLILKLPENWRISNIVQRLQKILKDWNDRKELARKKEVLTLEFQKLNWTDNQIWKMTSQSCGCLDDAVRLLANRLINHCIEIDESMNDRRLFERSKELVESGFDRHWK